MDGREAYHKREIAQFQRWAEPADVATLDIWNRETDRGSAGFVIAGVDVTAVRLDDRATNREADAHAAVVGGNEGIEHPGKNIRINAGALVGDAEFHIGAAARSSKQNATRDAGLGGGIAAVAEEVDEHPLELGAVDEDRLDRTDIIFDGCLEMTGQGEFDRLGYRPA